MFKKLSLGLMVVSLWAGNALGAKYYIDFFAGADTNNGTAKNAAWKHVKGMNGKAIGKAAAHTLIPGDTMIFKGGVVWDSTCFPETIGTVGRVVGLAFMVDSSWYSGGNYSRPVFDFMSKQHGPTTNDALIYANYKDNLVMRGLEFKNAKGPVTGKANAVHIYCYGADNTVWEDLYFHNWHPSRPGNNGDESGWCGCIIFNDCSTTVVRNCIMTGVDSGGSSVRFFGTANTSIVFENNEVGYLNCGLGVTSTNANNVIVRNNNFHHVFQGHFDSLYHTDVMILSPQGTGYGSIYNNTIHDIATISFALNRCNWKVYSNTIYNADLVSGKAIGTQAVLWSANGVACASCSLSVFNNYIEGGVSYVYNQGNPAHIGYLGVKNNIITYKGVVIGDTVRRIAIDHNLYLMDSTANPKSITYFGTGLTRSEARAHGWDYNSIWTTQPLLDNTGKPQAGSAVIGKGENLYSYFTHDLDGNTRPADGAWDIGAYENSTAPVQESMTADMPNTHVSCPNPVKLALLKQYLQNNPDVKIYNLAGCQQRPESMLSEGVYVFQDGAGDHILKTTVIK